MALYLNMKFFVGVIMKTISMMLLLFLSNVCSAQINIEYLNDVPAEFKEKYYSQKRDYNPLQVGNMWQYYSSDPDYNSIVTTRVVQDSVINGKRYFKKIYYQVGPPVKDFVAWERNDTASGVSFMLDFEDANGNGDYSEELPIDSLENPWWTRYTTYKYSFAQPNPFSFFPGEKTTLVGDTNWIKLDGDTLISRDFQIGDLFWWEMIIEKFGVYAYSLESPIQVCTGAIINGKKYGAIVGVEDEGANYSIPAELSLENNYPNPFNPTTTIRFSIPKSRQDNYYFDVKLIVYDPLGREVATLFNEQKTAGTYSITFNARRLSSGVYYYSLISGKNIITKPMILIK